MAEDGSLKPGEKIKPELSLEDARAILREQYDIEATDLQELCSYDDRNYLVTVKSGAKYVFKLLNTLDSKSPSHTSAQNQMMLHLRSKGINCPEPIQDKRGEFVTEVRLKTEEERESVHLARVLTYLPGEVLHSVPYTKNLLYQIGETTARVVTALRDFHHEGILGYNKIWRLDGVPRVKDFIFAVGDLDRRNLVSKIIDEFSKTVTPQIDSLEQSAIHGDLNEQNLLVKLTDNKYELCAVIDFGDIHSTCAVFELAIAMCYMILGCTFENPLDAGGYVLAGYLKHRKLSEKEFSLLKICIAARYSQSLTLGAYSFLQDGDEYVLTTAKKGWSILERLWLTPEMELFGNWKSIISAFFPSNEETVPIE